MLQKVNFIYYFNTIFLGIDLYFDNVGGETLDITFNHMKSFGRIIACGCIS